MVSICSTLPRPPPSSSSCLSSVIYPISTCLFHFQLHFPSLALSLRSLLSRLHLPPPIPPSSPSVLPTLPTAVSPPSSLLPPHLAFESFRIIALRRSPLLGALSSFGCYLHTQRALTTLESVCNLTQRHALTPTHTSVKVNGVVNAQSDRSHAESYLLCTNQWPCRCVQLYLTFSPVKPSQSQSITIPQKDK